MEGRNFSIRKYVLQYDNVMNKQREIIYAERRKVLFGEDLKDYIMNMAAELIEGCIKPITVASKYPEEWDLETMNANLNKICNRFKGVAYTEEGLNDLDEEILIEDVMEDFHKLYEEKEEEIGQERMRELERMILIRVVDNKWMDHIDAMDQLKEGIGLRAMGQQDPAGAYAQEGFDMFEEMIEAIKEETVKFCYNVTLQTSSERRRIIGGGADLKEEYEDDAAYLKDAVAGTNGDYEDTPEQNHQVPERQKNKQQPVKRNVPKVGRNDPCPCGSGKKYKHCCGKDN